MKTIKTFTYFLIFFFITLAALDLFIRFARIESPAKTEIDRGRGKILKPDQYSVYFNEGFYIGKPNAYGFYGPAYPKEKSKGTVRIALAGDSYIAGTQLFDKYHFRTLLEEKLRKDTGINYEVLNFGRAGFDFEDAFCLYSKFIIDFSPDMVLFFAAEKDFKNDNRDPLLPECVINKDGKLEIMTGFESKKSYKTYKRIEFIAGNSTIVKLISNCKKFYDKGELPSIMLGKLYTSVRENDDLPDTPEKQEKTGNMLSELNGKIFGQLSGRHAVVMCQNQLPDTLLSELDRNGINYYPFYTVFEKMKKKGFDPYYWSVTKKRGHWNHQAHEAVAEYLSDIIIKYIRDENGTEK